ncbi:MAG: hypothetical protein GC129_07130 [Proteobacteria bacterium]|nr:hypothetical protein [Pseudomonadota bacterium]
MKLTRGLPLLCLALAVPGAALAQGGVIPFTTYQAEQLAVSKQLPCKWISVGGTFAGGRYDFLCKGGTFATVSLFLNKPDGMADGVGEVKLMYRDWKPSVNPNAGEAMIAQQFLTFVVSRFVPASISGQVLQAFWDDGARRWGGSAVDVKVSLSDKGQYAMRELDVTGNGRTLVGVKGMAVSEQKDLPAPVPSGAGLLEEEAYKPIMAPSPETKWTPVTNSAPVVLPPPGAVPARVGGEGLAVPPSAPAGPVEDNVLRKALPAELNTAPAPESIKPIVPLPVVSQSLIPEGEDATRGKSMAPSNFDAYNKAEALTRDVEKRAKTQVQGEEGQKLEKARETLQAQPVQPAPGVAPVPTPAVQGGQDATVPGNGQPVRVDPFANEDSDTPQGNYDPNSAWYQRGQPLPQLKFVPRAEPLVGPEGSGPVEDGRSGL